MKPARFLPAAVLAAAALTFTACHSNAHPDDKAAVYKALDAGELYSVVVSQDQDAGVITLTGLVGDQARKDKAQNMAQQAAPGYRIDNQLKVDNQSVLGLAKPGARAPEVQTRPVP